MRLIVARDLMTPQVLSVNESQRLSEVAAFLTDHQISGAAVRDETGSYVGVVSATDVAAAAATGGERLTKDRTRPDFYVRGWEETLAEEELSGIHLEEDGLRVRDIMTPKIFSIPADAPVSEVARMLLEGHLHRLLVTEDDELVGVISTSDLLGLLLDEES
jgi:CBS domain-containing protein